MAKVHKGYFEAPLSTSNVSMLWEYETPDEGYEFERINVQKWRDYMFETWHFSFLAAGIYLFAIFGLQRYMKNRPAYNLRTALILWNAGLGVFSIIGFARTLPIMAKYMTGPSGIYDSLCKVEFANPQMVFWGFAFAISKFVELGDTLFIVLRKRPLQLLQWYHHIMTLIVVWITLPYAEPVGRWYVVMNYGVHSAMYPYFSLKMAGVDIPKVISNTITTAQLSQMVMGFLFNTSTIVAIGMGLECHRTQASVWAFVAVYGSFMVLFGKLFVNSVMKSGKNQKTM